MKKIKFTCGHKREVTDKVASDWKQKKKGKCFGKCLICNKEVELVIKND